MWWRTPYNPTAYTDNWEDQPAQSGFHKWALGVVVPAGFLARGIWVLLNAEAQVGWEFFVSLHGRNALAYGVAAASVAVFLHCHYFWGNIYNQAWFAVLGKIISACTFIVALVFLCVHLGLLGRG